MEHILRGVSISGGRCPSILVVDDEPSVIEEIRGWLEMGRMSAVCVQTSSDALEVASRLALDLAVIDYRLNDPIDGVKLGRTLLNEFGVPFILMSGFLSTSVTVEAMREGAADVIDKPLTLSQLLFAVGRLLPLEPPLPRPGVASIGESAIHATEEARSTSAKWTRMVLAACSAEGDPRTIAHWARAAGASAGTIRQTCRVCMVKPHDSRDLARFLRAISRSLGTSVPLQTHFAVADDRTLAHLFARAGVGRGAATVVLKDFFTRQAFVPPGAVCLRELAHTAANSPIFRWRSQLNA